MYVRLYLFSKVFYLHILIKVNVTNPRGIVVDPRRKSRLLFWSDWGRRPRIERAGLDGSNRTTIISTKIYWPNGLAIDLFRERIYFADAHLDYIESCDYNGQKIKNYMESLT